MKRLWVAIAIAIFTAALCSTEMWYTLSMTNKTENNLNAAIRLYEDGDKGKADEKLNIMNDIWNEHKGYMNMFLYHDIVENIGVSISSAKKYIEIDDDTFLVECEKIKQQLDAMRDAELPKFENIL